MERESRRKHWSRGGILLSVLIFAVVIATILAGLGALIVSFYSRANTESKYASAINLADAGANYELRKINENSGSADVLSSPYTGAMGQGTFTTYCTMSDGLTSWDRLTVPFYVFCTGMIGAESRQIKIEVTTIPNSGSAAGVFAVVAADTSRAVGVPTINGNIATDGLLDFTGNPVVTGSVTFDGQTAGWSSPPSGTYNVVDNSTVVVWPTTVSVALTQFPDSGSTAPGGLTYLSVHNDNSMASPAITGNSLVVHGNTTVTFYGKPGGANYYVTNLEFSGNATAVFNNTNGPITIWQGTSSGAVTLNGGISTVSMATSTSDAVRIYAATTSGVTINGNGVLECGIYNVTDAEADSNLNGTGEVDGEIITDKFTFNGNSTVNTVNGYWTIPGTGTYEFAWSYQEMNGL